MTRRDAIARAVSELSPEARIQALRKALAEVESENARHRYPTPGDLAADLDPSVVQTPALRLVDEAVRRTIATGGRLIITMPPQQGKSSRVAVWTPVWALMRNPDMKVVVASYAESLARRNAYEARRIVAEHGSGAVDEMTGAALPDNLGIGLARDHKRARSWSIEGATGGYYATGTGGALTGMAADCVHGDTGIITEYGNTTARQAYQRGDQWILSFNHEEQRSEWRRVEARRRIPGRPMVAVEAEDGNVLTCTPDHRVYTSRGYTPAGSLRGGEAILQAVGGDGVPPVRKVLRDSRGGGKEGYSAWDRPLLWGRVLRAIAGGEVPRSVLPGLLPADTEEQEVHVLGGVPGDHKGFPAGVEELSSVRGGVPCDKLAKNVLREDVRGSGALYTNDGEGEQTHDPFVFSEGRVQPEARGDHETGRAQVRCVRVNRFAGGSPQERELGGQPGRQPGDRMHFPSSIPPSRQGTVAGVTPSGVADAYDFQVEGNRNFFADGVLVHNCVIIDDPLKDQVQADSAREREKVWEWWTSVAQTRLSPTGAVVIIMTRWHNDDLVGRLLEADQKLPVREREWEVLNIPAMAEEGVPDALGREPGVALESARGTTAEEFRRIRRAVGERTWAALYQGVPTPPTGGLFGREEIDRSRVESVELSGRVVTIDPAESGRGDEAGILVMGWDADGTLYVEEDLSARMTSAQWARAAVRAAISRRASVIVYEAFTAELTYRDVLESTWRDIHRQAVLLRKHGRDTVAAADEYQKEGAQGDTLSPMQYTLEILDLIPERVENPPFRLAPWRKRGDKVARAAGARQSIELGKLRMVGHHRVLETQAVTWQSGQGSPDRVDAMVNGHDYMQQMLGQQAEVSFPGEW